MINKLIFSLGCMFAVTATAQTAGAWRTTDATVCKTAFFPKSSAGFNDNVEYTCGNKQKGTIPSFAKMGWHIVSIAEHGEVTPQNPDGSYITIMILEKISK